MEYYINWRRIPCLIVVIFLIAGIVAEPYLPYSQVWAFPALCTCLFTCYCLERSRKAGANRLVLSINLIIATFLGGVLLQTNSDPRNYPAHISNIQLPDAPIIGIATITDAGRSGTGKVRLTLELHCFRLGPRQFDYQGKVLAYLETEHTPNLSPGRKILFQGKILPIRAPLNPHAFDMQRYFARKGIYHQVFIRANQYRILPGRSSKPLHTIAFHARQWSVDVLRRYIRDTAQRALVSSLVLGYRAELTDEMQTGFARAGVMHVLAVSGLHVGIIFSLLYFLFGLPKGNRGNALQRILTFVGYCLLTGAYALITGLSASVMRATLMLWVFLLGFLIVRKHHALNALAFTAIVLLTIDPSQLHTVSFQFSFLAVAGILMFYKPIVRLLPFNFKLLKWPLSMVSISICAQIFLFPLLIWYFHQVSAASLFSSLIAIPLCYVILVLGLSTLAFHPLSEQISKITGWIVAKAADLFITCSEMMAGLPLSYFDELFISPQELIVTYLLLSLFLSWMFFRYKLCLLLSIACLFLLVCIRIAQHPGFNSAGETVVYASKNGIWVDIIFSDTVFSIHQLATEPPYGRTDHLLHWRKPAEKHIQPGLICNKGSITAYKNYMCIRGYCFALLDTISQATYTTSNHPTINFIVLHGSAYWDLSNWPFPDQIPRIIIANDIPYRTQHFLQKSLQNEEVPVYVISEEGAYSQRFEIQ